MTDNDPAATAALAERVAELDRLFPRREETTGRAMCAEWGAPAAPVRHRPSDVPWSLRDLDGEEVGVLWTDPTTQALCLSRVDRRAVRITDPAELARYRDGRGPIVARKPPTVRRDVASVTT